ncbi:MAG TPA: 16S rRNA (guanine(966)-N(2))-methyltransferase RsmD [Candidatus Limnocylindrales bacterium]
MSPASKPAGKPGVAAHRGAGRVVAGSARGIRLAAPLGDARPLGDRLKEALFATLEPELRGRAFLDLFAGSGAGGIEALSRGAARAVLVDKDPGALATIATNLAAAHLADAAIVRRGDAIDWLRTAAAAEGPFDIVLVDPPYDEPKLLARALETIAAAGPGAILAATGLVVAKHGRRTPPDARNGLLASVRERRFGESTLTLLRWETE